MTFLEFLDAMGESRYRKLLESVDEPAPLAEAFHSHLIDLLRRYYIPKLTQIWDSIPKHLAKENKKFVFLLLAEQRRKGRA